MTNAMKWFFGGVIAAIAVQVLTKDSDFAGIIFLVTTLAAVASGISAGDTTKSATLGGDEN